MALPDDQGCFGDYGGAHVPALLQTILKEIARQYPRIRKEPGFVEELTYLNRHFSGRPTPIFHCMNLSEKTQGAAIYLKREDLNHTGAHKINHCLGQALLAKWLGKTKLIAETGAGQHGVALATAATLSGLTCDIYMGTTDMAKEQPNVVKMKVLGARVIPVSRGRQSLKDALDTAFEAYEKDPHTQFYAIGSAVGPHPFPMIIRDFQEIIGQEARQQFLEMTGTLPDHLVACVGGGSNALGLFSAFLDDPSVSLHGVEAAGRSFKTGEHAATLTLGQPGILHGSRSYLLQDESGAPLPVYSAASGLDYPGVGPQHSLLKELGRVNYATVSDRQAIDAFFQLSRTDGIIPALESAHAVSHALELARTIGPNKRILVNLSGRGDKDMDYVMKYYGAAYDI